MKMPSRPFFPHELPADIFGLHRPTILELACETEEEVRARSERVRAGVASAFEAAVDHLGEERARSLFKSVIRRTKRGAGTHFDTDRNHRLLNEADAAREAGKSIAALARELFSTGLKLGASPQAIETQIRKLQRERATRARASAVMARRLRMATRNEPRSLASTALED